MERKNLREVVITAIQGLHLQPPLQCPFARARHAWRFVIVFSELDALQEQYAPAHSTLRRIFLQLAEHPA